MRRLFFLLAALGLLGAMGCQHGDTHWRGGCDCDDTWGCGCCPGYGHADGHAAGAPATPLPVGIPTTITPVKPAEPLPAPQK
jgi:hypothetical protein